jgi:hypothetical protein
MRSAGLYYQTRDNFLLTDALAYIGDSNRINQHLTINNLKLQMLYQLETSKNLFYRLNSAEFDLTRSIKIIFVEFLEVPDWENLNWKIFEINLTAINWFSFFGIS